MNKKTVQTPICCYFFPSISKQMAAVLRQIGSLDERAAWRCATLASGVKLLDAQLQSKGFGPVAGHSARPLFRLIRSTFGDLAFLAFHYYCPIRKVWSHGQVIE